MKVDIMNQRRLFGVDMDSFQKLVDGLDVQSCDELTGRLQEGDQQRYLDVCKKFEPWGREDLIHLSKIAPPNFFVDIIAFTSQDRNLCHQLKTQSRPHRAQNQVNWEQVFRLILKDYFEEFPERSVLVYQNWIMGLCKKIVVSGNAGLPLKDLPAFEIALIPDQKLYREFFALRIKQCILELRPSVTWSHVYSFPPEVQIADPPEEITEWVTDSSKSSFEYKAWVYLQEKELGLHPNIGDSNHNLPLRGWVLHYPSLSKLSPTMLDNIRTPITFTHSTSVLSDGKKRSAPTFDDLSCNLNYATNLASLSYILGHERRGSAFPIIHNETLRSTTVLPIVLRSLENSLAVEPKQSTPNTNPHSLIPAPLSQLTTFSIKTSKPIPPQNMWWAQTLRRRPC
ncbi:uncharacterized protein EAF02_006256 [Botrytis sinoallii]|uniref:uncharacterized protein n=1 Tax=Botrytis sinoallii TaxID=1463999 RepID=UPI00190002FB|nr:uncharacterized protein EAF02_006256 [Botrytis sinoallii]KAF7881568.1 hypothetical protein EAF02_006256 [Botrytis sinoallii]